MGRERFVENNVIRNQEDIFRVGDLAFIRRSRIGRGFGVADLVFLPTKGPHRLIIVEAKQSSSADAKSKIIGQLLMYYAGALRLGTAGIRLMRTFAERYQRSARSLRPVSLRMLNGGVGSPQEAWRSLCGGRRLRPAQIKLCAALDCEPGESLKGVLEELWRHHGLSIRVISVLRADHIVTWEPAGAIGGDRLEA